MFISPEQLEAFHSHRGNTAQTRQRVRGCLNQWARLGLEEISSESLATYRDRRLEEGRSPSTVRVEVARLRALGKWVGVDLTCKLPRAVQRAPVAWTRKQLKTLFRQARRTHRTIYGVPGTIFWPALLGLCYDTGERIGAIKKLEWSDVDLESRTVRYRAEIRKGHYRDAVGRISRQTTRDLLRLQQVTDTAKIFTIGHKANLWRQFTLLLEDAGLPSDRRSKFHRLRRTHATQIHLAGGDATAALGHSSDAVTRDHYLDPRQIGRALPWRPGWWGRLWG